MVADDGFLIRWARRKADARQGKPLEEPELPEPATPPAPEPQSKSAPMVQEASAPPEPPPPLTLEDTQSLTQHSDFRPFMAQQVQPEVRNAAMKKLFSDPHYNVMDGLDTYIDDYTKSDPIPESMLRQMVGAQFLKLFDDEAPVPESVAQSTDSTEPRLPPDHANTHLRLQPDHAPAGPDTGDRPA